MSTSERNKQIKLILSAFSRLARCCEHKVEWDRYLAIHEQEEKDHRRFKPDGLRCGLTRGQSVALFAVKEVFERFVPAHENESMWTPKAEDFFHVKKSVFGACAIAAMCGDRILREFPRPEMSSWLRAVDYVELNKTA